MKDDLTQFEKTILTVINMEHGTKYNYKNLMEWSSDKSHIEKTLRHGEIMYSVLSVHVAIKP